MLGRSASTLYFALMLAMPSQDAEARNKRIDDASTMSSPAPSQDAEARNKNIDDASAMISLAASPTLAPFQHVRFCLRYPRDCQTDTKSEPILPQMMVLLKSVNDNVNQEINPRSKDYDEAPYEGWTIAPDMGDCNDYAVTKRHELLMRGFPSGALRLSVAKTPEGVGHLVLVVTTTDGNMVMDNLTEEILPWQSTDYQWLKIQSANDPHLWNEIKKPLASNDAGRPPKNSPDQGRFRRTLNDLSHFPGRGERAADDG
jgi:predicted transglutaminase-like cysteine proteinase